MDGRGTPTPGSADVAPPVRHAEAYFDDTGAIDRISAELSGDPLALVVLFVCPRADFAAVMRDAARAFAGTPTIGCTTAGEIGRSGYADHLIVAVGFPRAHFHCESLLVDRLDALDAGRLISQMVHARGRGAAARPEWRGEFGFLLVDGLSLMEDRLAAACADALGPVPLFGGSAGDGTRFQSTAVAIDGEVYTNAAILTYFRSDCRVRVFSHDHLTPSDRKMVVTEADPERRIVRQINAEPAAREYARILGKDPGQLDTFTFAAHPVVVRFGGQHHVRAIQQVCPDGSLVFFSAIEEGLVLTLADAMPMDEHLRRALAALENEGTPPTAILVCDCILRRMEAQEKQLTKEISSILAEHGAIGFSTYGEQVSGMHVNQTLTGVAFYEPERP